MVLSYAKSALGKIKETLGIDSKDDFEQVDSAVNSIFEQESEISKEFANINEKFDSKTDRAYERMLESEEEEYSLEQEIIDDNKVRINRGQGIGIGIFSEEETIDIEAENVLEYVEGLGEQLNIRNSEIDMSRETLRHFDTETVGELLETEPSESDSYAESIIKSANVKGMLEQKNSEIKTERKTLENELSDTVEKYTRKIYEEAKTLSKELGGTERSEEGEFDVLKSLANSRSNLIEKSHPETVIDRTSALKKSGEALGAQSRLVKQYVDKLDSYRNNIQELFDTATNYLDPEEISKSAERVKALDQGINQLKDVINGNDYDSIEEALTDTVEKGLTNTEPDPAQYFQFNEKTYSQEDIGEGEEAIP